MFKSKIIPWPPASSTITTIDASQVVSGVLDPARLSSGTPAAGKYPDGAGAWTSLPGGGGGGSSSAPLMTNADTVHTTGAFFYSRDDGFSVSGRNGPALYGNINGQPYFRVPAGVARVRLRAEVHTFNNATAATFRILGYQHTYNDAAGISTPTVSTYYYNAAGARGEVYNSFCMLPPSTGGQSAIMITPIWDVYNTGDMFALDCDYTGPTGSISLSAFSIEGWP